MKILTRAHPLARSWCVWNGLAWRDQPVVVAVQGTDPVLGSGDHGRGLAVPVYTPEGHPPPHADLVQLTLAQVLERCPAGTVAVIDPLRAPYLTLTAADLPDDGPLRSNALPHLVVGLSGHVRDASARRPALTAGLQQQLGPGELVSYSDGVRGSLLFVTAGALPADLALTRAAAAEHHPVPAVFVVATADLPTWFAHSVDQARTSDEGTS